MCVRMGNYVWKCSSLFMYVFVMDTDLMYAWSPLALIEPTVILSGPGPIVAALRKTVQPNRIRILCGHTHTLFSTITPKNPARLSLIWLTIYEMLSGLLNIVFIVCIYSWMLEWHPQLCTHYTHKHTLDAIERDYETIYIRISRSERVDSSAPSG